MLKLRNYVAVFTKTSPSVVRSILPLTSLANHGSWGLVKVAVMIGVLMFAEALIISFILKLYFFS